MSKYIFSRGTFHEVDDELMHWKYIKREKINGKWRYYYDYKSLKKDVKKTVNTAINKVRKATSSSVDDVRKYTSRGLKAISGNSTSGKKTNKTKSIINAVKKRVFKYIAKVPSGDSYRYFYSTKAYQAYLKGKNAVDKALDTKLNMTPSDVTKANAKNFTLKAMLNGFGKSVYNVVAPALCALQVELTTPKSFDELKKNETKQSSDEHQKTINPKYNRTTYDYSMNCSFCTAAYDLRKRGYDVEANPISQAEAYTVEDIASWYKNPKIVSKSDVNSKADKPGTSQEKLINELKTHGDGARGHLAIYWLDGSGHDVIWEVENGEVVLRDCQNGTVSRTFDYLEASSTYSYIRTDNLECTEDILRTVRNRKER